MRKRILFPAPFLVSAVLFLMTPAVAPAADPLFDSPINYSVGDGPRSVTCGDFDGDGNSDIAVANRYSDHVSILLGNGDGTFVVSGNFSAGDGPFSVTTNDFDGDGYSDLAVANDESNNVSILLGNGDGTFVCDSSYAVGTEPLSVASYDFDCDGDSDLAVANDGSDNMSVLLGNGDGTFASSVEYDAGNSPQAVTGGDLDGDGDIDLAVASEYSDGVQIYLGNGDGTFGSATGYPVGDHPQSVTCGDYDHDGDIDLAVANQLSNNVSILLGNGDGTYSDAVNYNTGEEPRWIISNDFDGDGDSDLAVANIVNDNNVNILLGNGDGTFGPAESYNAGICPGSIAGSDFDGDGDMDLTVANVASDNVSILINLSECAVSTLLSSFACSVNGDDIELSWTLSTSEEFMKFSVYRMLEGNSDFAPVNAGVIDVREHSFRIVDEDLRPGACYRYRVDVTDEEGTRTLFTTESIAVGAPSPALRQNYPNPSNPSTTIRYGIPERSHVTLDIFDVAGRRITRLVNAEQEAGSHEIVWSGRNEEGAIVSSGVYFYTLAAGKKVITRKMILMK